MPKRAHDVRLTWPGKASGFAGSNAGARLEPDLPESSRSNAVLIEGDNITALRALQGLPARATLVYLDPPFFTQREHERVERARGPRGVERRSFKAFDDRWANFEQYLSELGQRIAAARELLAPEGCLVLHVDPKTSHYAKVLCDEIFGVEAFASEIVWRYRRWPAKTRNFQRVHDVLLRYVRDPEATPRFRQLYEPLAASTEKTWGAGRQRAVVNADGRRYRSSVTDEPSPGVPLGDVWDISIIAPVARERTGYPTQKPEALIERLIEACTDPLDLVIDAYAGSGTTLAVSTRLGRRAIGIDQNPEAIALTRKRLGAQGVDAFEHRVVAGPSIAQIKPERVAKTPRTATAGAPERPVGSRRVRRVA
ncbi:MAG TPA: site-specific DNA-methyltransferase [Polyangiaceae bacterium]|nr:site-specific DNA-methyltransferase [Polyangiaceae bacterium]